MRLGLLAVVCLALAGAARGEVLRVGTMAPDGTAWARELKAFARDVEAGTNGRVTVKWYFGGVAGDELRMLERIRRGQLDGAASGGPLCEALAPSMRALRVLGLLTNPTESTTVLWRFNGRFGDEARTNGFAMLGTVPIGPHIVFSRTPVNTLDDLRHLRFWVWDRDDVMLKELPELGVRVVALSVDEAARAYDEKRVDGFFTPPSVALAFQWSTQARYVTDLRVDYLAGCVVLADRAIDPLPNDAQKVVRSAGAKLTARFAEVSRSMDAALLGGLFARHGLTIVPPTSSLRADFLQAAQQVRERLGARLADQKVLNEILSVLADYRAEHAEDTTRPR